MNQQPDLQTVIRAVRALGCNLALKGPQIGSFGNSPELLEHTRAFVMPNWEFPQCRPSDSRLILTAMNDDFPILAAIASKPTHSHALLEHLQAAGVTVTKSTLYRRVDSLLAKGWLETEGVHGDGVRSRRPLALSDAGRTRVDAEAAEILCSEPLESPFSG
jgi:hypothetical protein